MKGVKELILDGRKVSKIPVSKQEAVMKLLLSWEIKEENHD